MVRNESSVAQMDGDEPRTTSVATIIGETVQVLNLGEVIRFGNGKAIKPGGQGKYPVFGSNGIIGGSDEYRYENGIIIGRVGAYCGSIAYCPNKFWASDNTLVAFPASKRIDVKFLFYLLTDAKLSRYAGGAAQPLVTQTVLKQVEVKVPPLPIQKRIADILSAYDELIENNQRRIKILESMARSLYREWFIHFRYPGHESIPLVPSPLGPIPQGWEVKPIQHFGKIITGKTPSKANADFYGDDVPFVKTPDMHGNMFILGTNESLSVAGAESQANKTLPASSICVSCIGTIGVVSITTEKCQTNQQINSVNLENGASLEFLFFRLQDAKQTLENLGSNGATMGNVNKGKFEALEIVAPLPELLADYHRFAQPIFEEVLTLSRKIQNLRQTRDLLLPRLLSGQVNLAEN